MKKILLFFVFAWILLPAVAHQGEFSAEDWDEQWQQLHAEDVAPVPFFHAAAHGDTAEIQRLLEDGADVNMYKNGATALKAATARRQMDVVRILLNAGADPNAEVDFGETPLLYAAIWGDMELGRLLLDSGANPDLREDNFGHTALMYAVMYDHPEFAKMLLDDGADVNVKDKEGKTALYFIDFCGFGGEMPAILIDGGASSWSWGKYFYLCMDEIAREFPLWQIPIWVKIENF